MTHCGQVISERLTTMSSKRNASFELAAVVKKLQIQNVRTEQNFSSKRKFTNGEDSLTKKPKPPKNGERPVFTVYLSWEGLERSASPYAI